MATVSIIITLTTVGTNQGSVFNLYSNTDGFDTPYEINVPLASLLAGYVTNAPENTTTVRVCGQDPKCTSCVDFNVMYTTTTTTTTSSPSTTTTTTTSDKPVGPLSAKLSTTKDPIDGCGLLNVDVTIQVYIDTQSNNTTPAVGDIVYTDAGGLTPFVGDRSYYKFTFDEITYYGAPIDPSGVLLSPVSICV